MTTHIVSQESRVETTPQQPSSLSPKRGDCFIIIRRGGEPKAVDLDRVERITTRRETSDEKRHTRLVFAGEPDDPDHFEGEYPFLVDESLEELLERVGAVL